jgi:DNA-binding PadR family transcriptional regulator
MNMPVGIFIVIYEYMGRPMGELSSIILKRLDDGELAMNDLFDFLMSRTLEGSGYGLSKEGYKAFKKRSWRRRVAMNAENQEVEEKQRFYNMMHNLHKQGLVTKEKQGVKTVVSITKKGGEKWRALKKFFARRNPADRPTVKPNSYPKIKSPSSIIVSFDIPEKEAYKRVWIRSVLRNLDYKILHESVWIGNNALPKELLDECRRMNMTKYIHIFSVLRKGTIKD